MNSLVIEVVQGRISCAMTEATESTAGVGFNDRLYRPTPYRGSVYDFLRAQDTHELIGVGLDVTAEVGRLFRDAQFYEYEAIPRWRLAFPDVDYLLADERIVSDWDQIHSDNPYMSEAGALLFVLQIAHLSHEDIERLQLLCSRFGISNA